MWLVLGLGLVACQDDVVEVPSCPTNNFFDVHFTYDTQSQLETGSCELTTFEPSDNDPSTVVVNVSCGYWLELARVSMPEMELEIGDAIEIATNVDEIVGCAENGWLSIANTEGRALLAVQAVAEIAAPMPFGDLGEIELHETSLDGCEALRLRAQGDEVTIHASTSTEVTLAGAKLLVQLGRFNDDPGSCGSERYGVVLVRLPD